VTSFYQASVSEFTQHSDDYIIGRQSAATIAGRELTGTQLEAWRQQIAILRAALCQSFAEDWHLILEYPIPRRGKRIDAVVLAESLILVIEFKCGSGRYDREAQVQVEDYCLDLRDFHDESRGLTLVPILVATHAEDRPAPSGGVTDFVAPLWLANADSLGTLLGQIVCCHSSAGQEPIAPARWATSQYRPTPTIIEAARTLYQGQNVREISRCHAGAENLTRTSEAVMEAIRQAREAECKLICFVTGVPGAGKTLAGLNVVHNRELHEGALGAFLSGNGPLVKVLSEALARDHSERTHEAIAESRRRVSAFIQNVHRFIDAHFGSSVPPVDRVIIFDEAQRAWNREQSLRKFKRDRSEPEIMLDVMNRHEGWAVIVALVGSGQEINTGEAGLREWGRALADRFRHWTVRISPQLSRPSAARDVDPLFERPPYDIRLAEDDALHLDVALRSYKAEALSEFVGHLLSRDVDRSRAALAACQRFPIAITRNLATARQWLKTKQRGSRRIGLIASSGGRRLRAHGLDVRTELDVENWFLNQQEDVRSSYYLETPATEFGIQGLELDWTGVCWDIDLVPERDSWRVQAFKGTKWQSVKDSIRRRYVINKYRVLLTRAREGMVIWVPRGDPSDWTRPGAKYDAIADYLQSCGLREI
jgi:DUF2075 family protein